MSNEIRHPYFYNPRKATLLEKFLLLFKRTRKQIDEFKDYELVTYYKTLNNDMFISAIEYRRKIKKKEKEKEK